MASRDVKVSSWPGCGVFLWLFASFLGHRLLVPAGARPLAESEVGDVRRRSGPALFVPCGNMKQRIQLAPVIAVERREGLLCRLAKLQ